MKVVSPSAVGALLGYEPTLVKDLQKVLLTNLILTLVLLGKGAGSSARLERSTDNRKVAGSNPARPTLLVSRFFRLTMAQSRCALVALGIFFSKDDATG